MRRLIVPALLMLTGCAQAPLAPAASQTASVAESRGQGLAVRDCAACHAILAGQQSPNASAPGFATIRLRHNELSLERLLTTIAHDGHFEMPRRPLSANDIEDLVAFIETPPP